VGAGVAANPGEAVLQEAAGEELIHDLGDHRAPVATGRGEALVPHQADESGHSRRDQRPTVGPFASGPTAHRLQITADLPS
jgi:hypothetical protein